MHQYEYKYEIMVVWPQLKILFHTDKDRQLLKSAVKNININVFLIIQWAKVELWS